MRKIVIFIFMITLLICILNKKNSVLIPNLAVRIRVIANSNDIKDQEIKNIIKNEVSSLLYSKLQNIDNYKAASKIIESTIPEVKNIINKYTNNYEINYGENYFPEKEYKGVRYEKGDYKSLLIKLGEGKGNNFWCVLFPPLCMIDESKLNNVAYSLYVTELLKKIK
ncbi:MAG: stage II sporulation protein R [Bacilli bacterium]|nr:stage II sporulation protein R [Bacilli bacterium]